MARLSVAELKEYIEPDLADVELQSIINQADSEVSDIIGDVGGKIEWVSRPGKTLYTQLPIGTISSVVEYDEYDNSVTLATDDYRIEGNRLIRLSTGSNWANEWANIVRVEYVPAVDTDVVKQVEIKLCRLYLDYEAIASQRVGDYSEVQKDLGVERAKILSMLGSRGFA